MPSDNIKLDDREGLEQAVRAAFARPVGESAGQLVPLTQASLGATNVVVTARKVEVERDEAKVLAKIRVMAQAAGEDWFYRYPTRNRDGTTGHIEGPSIKCANNVARMYGNCEIDTRIVDNGDSWIIYAKFADHETGFAYTRPFQQRKDQRAINAKDGGRLLEIALQIGISKSIRNVVTNALETFTNFAFEEAKAAIVGRIGAKIEYYRDRVLQRLSELKVDPGRVETTTGRAAKDWLAPDLARIIAQLQAVNDGMATVDETWPPSAGGAPPPRPTREEFKETPAQTEAVEPFTVTDMVGDETEWQDHEKAIEAYRLATETAYKQSEKALTTVWDNNQPLMKQLDEAGHTDWTRELSFEYGRLREAAADREVPRGTAEPTSDAAPQQQELRSSDAAERPDRDERAPPSQPAHPGESSPVARETPPQTLSPATSPQPERKVTVSADHAPSGSLSSASADATIPVAGDLPLSTPRDIRFWGRKDGSLRLLAAAPDAFMLELPIRLAECRDWDETENIERANRGLIGKLSTEDRIEMSGMFARRREELRGA